MQYPQTSDHEHYSSLDADPSDLANLAGRSIFRTTFALALQFDINQLDHPNMVPKLQLQPLAINAKPITAIKIAIYDAPC